MSSHHVVKDKQEPALIIANGQECSMELLGQLLEWSPYTVVLDGAIDRVLKLGVHIDAVLGDFDSFIHIDELKKERPTIQVINTPNQDYTDLQKAINWLIEQGHKAVNVVWASGRRMDHAFNNLLAMSSFSGKINWRLLDNWGMVYALPRDFKKHYTAGAILSLFGVPYAGQVISSNLKYNLQGQDLLLPQSSCSNEVAQTGLVHIQHKSGTLLLMECHD